MPVPITYNDLFYAKLCGAYTGDLPEAVTAEQKYLVEIAKRIATGGTGDSDNIVVFDFENTTQYRQMNATVASFVANVDYTENANDYSITNVTPYYSATTTYSKEEPDGLKINVPDNSVLTVAQGEKTRNETVSGAGAIYNMEPLKAGTLTLGEKTYKIVSEGGVRMIYTPSVWNVRDLGGWACDGGSVKYGKIFRGGHFGSITAADKAAIVDWLGIKTDIDLRNNTETGGATASPLGSTVEYFHQSLDYYANAVSTSAASARTVSVLKKIMACVSANKPCYFHCMSGADRTGTIAYLLLSLLGVSQSDKDKDYELTAFSDEADGRRFRNSNYNVTNGNGWYPLVKYFRDHFTGESDNEKVIAWAVASGITIDEINAFRKAMVNGSPEILSIPVILKITKQPQSATVQAGSSATVSVEATGEELTYLWQMSTDAGSTWTNTTFTTATATVDSISVAYNGIQMRCVITDKYGNSITSNAATLTVIESVTYTNVLPSAVDPGTKSGVWDSKGYRNGAYASSASPYYGTDAACWCTGAIAVQPSDVIYVKGAMLEGSGHNRLGALSQNGCFWCKEYAALAGMATVTKLGDKYYKIVLDSSHANYANTVYIIFSAQGTGDNVIVTKNEPIE